MKFRVLYGMILISLISQFGYAQTITMKEFLETAKRNHPLFDKEALSPKIERIKQEGLLGATDWTISSAPFYVHQKPLSTSAFSPERIDMLGTGIAIERAFWKTGGRLSLSWASDFTDQVIPDIVIPYDSASMVIPVGPSKFYKNKVSLKYSQPLLQNFGGKLDRLNYELSQYEIDFAKVQSLENKESFLLDLIIRFLDWILISEQKWIANERLKLADEELQRTMKKRAANLVRKVDVLRAQDAVRIAKQYLVLVESQWKGKQAELAVLSKSPELYNLLPKFDLYKLETLPQPDEAVSKLSSQSRILKVLDIRRQQLNQVRDGFAEMRKPLLFFDIGADLQSGNEQFGSSLGINKPDISFSLMFRYPLGNRAARADMARTSLELRKLDKEIEEVALGLEAGVRNLLVLIKELEKVLTLNEEQIESAQQKTQEELRLYNQGRSDLTFVIQSRDNEENAKLNRAQNAVNYHKLVLQYHALMDELLEAEF